MDPLLARAALHGPASLTVHACSDGFPMLLASEGLQALWGYSTPELMGNGSLWSSRIHEEDIGRVMRGLEEIVKTGSGEICFRFLRRDDAERWISAEVRTAPVEGQSTPELVFSLRDVTDQKEYVRALRAQADALRRSNVELEQFAHIASHDLSEPLRMVASYTNLIADRYADQLDDDARDFIGFAVSGATRMQAMIEDLLTYSRLSQAKPDLGKLDLNSVLEAVRALLRGTIEESGAQITVDTSLPYVMGAEGQCRTVLQNVIANAIKFSDPDRAPEISIAATQQDDFWRIEVTDNGIGIAPASQERVFDAFKKLHRPEQYPGTGLGLSLCRRIVNHHGGSMGLESEPGVGTTVWFTLGKAEEDSPELALAV